MNRRNFINNSALATAGAFFFGGQVLNASQSRFLQQNAQNLNGKVLILVQLNGGNDGLNTLVPIDRLDSLMALRRNIMPPSNSLLNITPENALHPAMPRMQQMFREEKLMFVQNVGYPNPNLSHFRSKDIFLSASDSDKVVNSGWIGRYMQNLHPKYPAGYPNSTFDYPLCLTLGTVASPICMSQSENFSLVIKDSKTGYLAPRFEESSFPDNPYGHQLRYVASQMDSTEKYLKVVTEAGNKGTNGDFYPAQNPLADQLKLVAKLISGGLGTMVYVVNHNGYDTHSDQVDEASTLTGRHSILLKELSEAIDAFTKDLYHLGLQQRVLGMVFSEFGRRVVSNQSFGTDHGTSYPVIFFGSSVNPVVYGNNPLVDKAMTAKDNLAMETDFRSLYASVLSQWLGDNSASTNDVLFREFPAIPILKNSTLATDIHQAELRLYPVPASARINYQCLDEVVLSTQIIDINGRLLYSSKTPNNSINNVMSIDISDMPSGTYILSVQTPKGVAKRTFLKR